MFIKLNRKRTLKEITVFENFNIVFIISPNETNIVI